MSTTSRYPFPADHSFRKTCQRRRRASASWKFKLRSYDISPCLSEGPDQRLALVGGSSNGLGCVGQDEDVVGPDLLEVALVLGILDYVLDRA